MHFRQEPKTPTALNVLRRSRKRSRGAFRKITEFASFSCVYAQNGRQFEHMYTRILKLSTSQSFFLFGPRGSGKSTLLQKLFSDQNVLWIDLLDQRTEFELSKDPDSLLNKWLATKQKWIVIDEVQKIPALLNVVHLGMEKHRILFALTGSSARKLKRGGANLLGGRASAFYLSPFCAQELGADFQLQKALQFGLLPRFWSDLDLPDVEIVRSLYAYVQTYLKEEVAAEQLVRNLDPFRRFLVSAAQSNSKILNYSNIEREAGVSHSQAERHFEIICDTLLGRYLPPFNQSIRKRQSKKSKFYFFDTGVVRALKNLAGESLHPSTYEYGELFETFLINEFFKLKESLEKRWEFSYLRTKDNTEIDLIIEKPRGKPILVEIKSATKIGKQDVEAYNKIAREFPGSEVFLLYCGIEELQFNKVHCLPWQKGLQKIFE